jgi:hypothetical protein
VTKEIQVLTEELVLKAQLERMVLMALMEPLVRKETKVTKGMLVPMVLWGHKAQ